MLAGDFNTSPLIMSKMCDKLNLNILNSNLPFTRSQKLKDNILQSTLDYILSNTIQYTLTDHLLKTKLTPITTQYMVK